MTSGLGYVASIESGHDLAAAKLARVDCVATSGGSKEQDTNSMPLSQCVAARFTEGVITSAPQRAMLHHDYSTAEKARRQLPVQRFCLPPARIGYAGRCTIERLVHLPRIWRREMTNVIARSHRSICCLASNCERGYLLSFRIGMAHEK